MNGDLMENGTPASLLSDLSVIHTMILERGTVSSLDKIDLIKLGFVIRQLERKLAEWNLGGTDGSVDVEKISAQITESIDQKNLAFNMLNYFIDKSDQCERELQNLKDMILIALDRPGLILDSPGIEHYRNVLNAAPQLLSGPENLRIASCDPLVTLLASRISQRPVPLKDHYNHRKLLRFVRQHLQHFITSDNESRKNYIRKGFKYIRQVLFKYIFS
jgi:hypothetical protein